MATKTAPRTKTTTPDTAARAKLAELRRRREAYPDRAETAAAVAAARAAGLSASEISEVLGVQRQALYKRFHAEITGGK